MAKKKEFSDKLKLQAHADMLDTMMKLMEEFRSDRDYATSALSDTWLMLRVIDTEKADKEDLKSCINCAMARITVAFDVMESMKNDE